jgi:NifU-like protein involved in Fe-S cluster formation
MLKSGDTAPKGDWQELAVFAPVQETRSRHICVRLPFEAVIAAMAEAQTKGAG